MIESWDIGFHTLIVQLEFVSMLTKPDLNASLSANAGERTEHNLRQSGAARWTGKLAEHFHAPQKWKQTAVSRFVTQRFAYRIGKHCQSNSLSISRMVYTPLDSCRRIP